MLYDGFGYFAVLTGMYDLSTKPLISDTRPLAPSATNIFLIIYRTSGKEFVSAGYASFVY